MSIEFTQYLMPNGRPRAMTIQRPQDIEDLARSLAAHGFQFEVEVLTTGEVSMEILRRRGEISESLAQEICPNGPEVPIAVDKMIQDGHKTFQEIRRSNAKSC